MCRLPPGPGSARSQQVMQAPAVLHSGSHTLQRPTRAAQIPPIAKAPHSLGSKAAALRTTAGGADPAVQSYGGMAAGVVAGTVTALLGLLVAAKV